jgi:hypothetical protein
MLGRRPGCQQEMNGEEEPETLLTFGELLMQQNVTDSKKRHRQKRCWDPKRGLCLLYEVTCSN